MRWVLKKSMDSCDIFVKRGELNKISIYQNVDIYTCTGETVKCLCSKDGKFLSLKHRILSSVQVTLVLWNLETKCTIIRKECKLHLLASWSKYIFGEDKLKMTENVLSSVSLEPRNMLAVPSPISCHHCSWLSDMASLKDLLLTHPVIIYGLLFNCQLLNILQMKQMGSLPSYNMYS